VIVMPDLTETPAKRTFDAPEETRRFADGQSDVLSMGGLTLSRTVFEPGWRWSTSVKPIVGGESCQVRHIAIPLAANCTLSWTTEPSQCRSGDVVLIPPGHDGWTVGDSRDPASDRRSREHARSRP
jgi:hypothetical protein